MRRTRRRTLVWSILLTAVAGILIVLLVLIGLGYLVLPGPTPPSVTVTEVTWSLLQGTDSHGIGWFGGSSFNYSMNDGYPTTFRAGSTFTLPWSPENFDSVSHTIYTVTVSAPFELVSSRPALPYAVAPGDDSGNFSFTITTSSTTSGAYVLQVTVNALSAG